MTPPDDSSGPSGPNTRPLLGVVLWSLVVIGILVTVVFVPIWKPEAGGEQEAGELIDLVDQDRAAVLDTAALVSENLAPLGPPVRAWSEVRCHLTPRISDGDGESGVVSYYQDCLPAAYEIYSLPPQHATVEQAATLLRGELLEPTDSCDELILGVGEIGFDPQRSDQTIFVSWKQPPTSAAADGQEACELPVPGDGDATRVQLTVDESLTAGSYVVLEVYGMYERIDVGCQRSIGLFGECTPPEGAPYLPESPAN